MTTTDYDDRVNSLEIDNIEKDEIPLLNAKQNGSCECYKKWNNIKFILFSIIIALLSAILTGILSNIDRIIVKKDDESLTALINCSTNGVYYGPPVDINGFVWRYDNSDEWDKYYPQCGCNSHQSPINIDTKLVRSTTPKQICYDNSSLLQWEIDKTYLDEYNGTFQVFHSEHTVQIKNINYLNDSLIPIATLKNLWQPLNSTLHSEFILEQIHFHWGYDQNGSEHSLDGKHYPLSIHFVHYSNDYNSIQDAFNDWKQLNNEWKDRYTIGMVAAFFEIDPYNKSVNPAINQLLSSEVLNSNNSNSGFVERINLMDLLPNDTESYYYYPGSMTTPPCSPIVRWHVLSTPLLINLEQIQRFRSIAGERVSANLRPIQKNINNVYACHADFIE